MFPGKDVHKIMPLSRLFDVNLDKLDELSADKYKLFEEVSPINYVTKDDPPALLTYATAFDGEVTNANIGIHHPLFGKLLKEKMDSLGIPCEVYAANKRLGGGTPMKTIDFLRQHFGLKD